MKTLRLLFLVLLVTGCTERVQYTVGWVTKEVTGRLGALESKPFVILVSKERSFIENAQGPLFETRARVIRPSESGHYIARFGERTAGVELIFVAQNYHYGRAEFKRTLGVVSYQFDHQFEGQPKFKNYYYLTLKPLLTGFIIEPGYQMPESDQLFLGNWMSEVEANLETDTQP